MARSGLLKVARVFAFTGAVIIFALGVAGLVFSCLLHCNRDRHCALCVGATVVAIVVGLFIAITEAHRRPIGGLNNTLLRGVLWILLVILPFWGWYSWVGSVLVLIGALFYIVAWLTGRHHIDDVAKDGIAGTPVV